MGLELRIKHIPVKDYEKRIPNRFVLYDEDPVISFFGYPNKDFVYPHRNSHVVEVLERRIPDFNADKVCGGGFFRIAKMSDNEETIFFYRQAPMNIFPTAPNEFIAYFARKILDSISDDRQNLKHISIDMGGMNLFTWAYWDGKGYANNNGTLNLDYR